LVLSEPEIREPVVSAFYGNGPVLEIYFPPTNAQWIRLTQTGTANVMGVVAGVQFYSPPIPSPQEQDQRRTPAVQKIINEGRRTSRGWLLGAENLLL
jgi:hypothetical protein